MELIYYIFKITLFGLNMESLPKTLIEVLNSAMKENQTLSWRIHGMDDKVIMNLMWTTRNRYLKDNGRESMLSSRSARNMDKNKIFITFLHLSPRDFYNYLIGTTSGCMFLPNLDHVVKF
jgi:hypothetical protein